MVTIEWWHPLRRDSTDFGIMEFNTDESSLGCLNLSVMKAFLFPSIYLVLGVPLKMIMVNSSLFCEASWYINYDWAQIVVIEEKNLFNNASCVIFSEADFLNAIRCAQGSSHTPWGLRFIIKEINTMISLQCTCVLLIPRKWNEEVLSTWRTLIGKKWVWVQYSDPFLFGVWVRVHCMARIKFGSRFWSIGP